MYVEYTAFQNIPDETPIWRYMDLASFLFLVEESSLHFSRLDKLEDKFEGSLGVINIRARQDQLNEVPEQIREHFLNSSIRHNEEGRKCIFVNCWSINEHESAALWKIFTKGNGIAIRSTIGRLKKALEQDTSNAVLFSPINYFDPTQDGVSFQTAITPYTFKRKSFEYEREFRAIIVKFPTKTTNGDPITVDPFNKNESAPIVYSINTELNLNEGGLDLPITTSELIKELYISPNSPEWFFRLVDKTTKNKKLNFLVKKSSLDDPALY
jgi:hypothetical protein